MKYWNWGTGTAWSTTHACMVHTCDHAQTINQPACPSCTAKERTTARGLNSAKFSNERTEHVPASFSVRTSESFDEFQRLVEIEVLRIINTTTKFEQALLMDALFSGKEEGLKLDYLFNVVGVRLSPDDTAVIACAAAVAWAGVADAKVQALEADADTHVSAAGARADLTTSAAFEKALDEASACNEAAESAQQKRPMRFDESALLAVLNMAHIRDVTKQLGLMVTFGLKLTPLMAKYALRIIIALEGGDAHSAGLLRLILDCEGGVNLHYVSLSEELPVVHYAVNKHRRDLVEILLEHDPSTVHAVSPNRGLTVLHCVTPKKRTGEYVQARDGHLCEGENCCQEMVSVLIERGADPFVADKSGRHPSICQQGRTQVVADMHERFCDMMGPFTFNYQTTKPPPCKKAKTTRNSETDPNERFGMTHVPEAVLTDHLYPLLVAPDHREHPCFPRKPFPPWVAEET